MTATTTPQPARTRPIWLGRVSDNRDETDQDTSRSLDNQIRRVRERAAQLGWDLCEVIEP
jgi:hypothetical protein